MREPPAPPTAPSGRATRFGDDMRAAFGGPRSAPCELRELRFGGFNLVEVNCRVPGYGQSAPIPVQDALLVSLQLCTTVAYDLWEDGRRLECVPVRRGMVNLNDLRKGLVSASVEPFHALTLTIPVRSRSDADGVLEDLEPGRSRTGLYDPVIQGLGMALLPALEHPERASHLFIEHGLLALRAHLGHRFGARTEAPPKGGLSRRQLRRAQEFLEAHLSDNVSLSELAASCSLSAAHFARSFRHATGLPPHRYLVERRVVRARELLLSTNLPLSDIALECGFADQSHLTKAFRRVLGVTPGSMRRARH